MTPQEKAKELFDKMYQTHSASASDITKYFAKQCALIAVQEIIKALRKGVPEIGLGTGYWASVKQEIEKL
jgi:hypothetical protein